MSVIATPSRVQVFSPTPAPFAWKSDCWPDSAPPTLTRSTITPGTVCSTTHGSRADGRPCSSARLTLVEVVVFFGSIVGVSPVTTTTDSTPASDIVTRSGTLAPAATATLLLV
jgi:hypothetical protein